jgi:MFS family permease
MTTGATTRGTATRQAAAASSALDPALARRALLVLLASVAINLIGTTAYAPMLSIHARDLGATGLWVGLLYGGFYGVRLVIGRPIGAFSDRAGQRTVLLVSSAMYPLLALLYLLSPNVEALVGTRLLHGVASAMMLPMAMAYVGNLSGAGNAGRYASYFNFANFLGMAIGPLAGGLIVAYIAFTGPFYLLFILALLNLPLVYLLLPPLPGRVSAEVTGETARRRSGRLRRRNLWRETPYQGVSSGRARPSVDRVTVGLLVYNAVINANTILFVSFLPLLAREVGLSVLQGGLLISSIYLISSASQLPFGRLADRRPPLLLVLAGGVVAGVALLALARTDAFGVSLVIVGVLALGGSAATAGLSALAVEAGRRRSMGRFMGGFHSAASFGIVAGALGAGVILDSIGIEAVFLAAGIATLGLLAPVVLLLRGVETT